jgi:eukaryotic-like serine/threonine-protein kinase
MSSADGSYEKSAASERFAKLSALMDEALALPSSEQEAFCSALEATDAEHASMLRELLQAHAQANAIGFLERTISPEVVLADADTTAVEAGQSKQAGVLLGPYRLIRKLGEGGMSSVWLAERDHGTFTRQVALKCLPAYFGNAQFRERLLKEAMILGRLVHPGIAQLFDAGLSSDGDPYMALELVEGEPITEYCDRLKLNLKARVRLVAEACEAIAFLHSHSIVHRDIKPSNVFVDKHGRVKLLDFGIAKILDEASNEATLASAVAFTPEYAAPEQMTGGHITTATDIYAIGVLLYRLLTGTRPYARNATPMVVASAVLNTTPTRPSTLFLSTGGMSTQEAQRIADERNATVKQLRTALLDDLDNILLKCLEKERERRYATADALRADLLAHVESRPVKARPQSALYVLRKFARRHRGGVMAGGLAAAGLVSAIGFGAWQARLTQLEAQNTRRVLSFLQTLIAEANPNSSGVANITVLDLLKRAPDVANKQFPDAPALQYQVLTPVQAILRDLGALPPLEALGAEMVKLSDAVGSLPVEEAADLRRAYASTLSRMGKHKEADVVLSEAMKQLQQSGKTKTLTYAQSLITKAEAHILRREVPEAIRLAKEAHALVQSLLAPGNPERTSMARSAASVLMADLRFVEAGEIAKVDLTEETIAQEPKLSTRLQHRITAAGITAGLGNASLAAKKYAGLVEETERVYGGRHDTYLTLLWLSARAHVENGDYVAAIKTFEQTLAIIRRDEAANTLSMTPVNVLPELAAAQIQLGQIEQARASLKECEERLERLGRKGGTLYRNAAYLLAMADGNYELAEFHLKQWTAIFPPTMPAMDMNKVRVDLQRANWLRVKGEAAQALGVYDTAIAAAKAQMAPMHYQIARAELLHAKALADANQTEKALPIATVASQQLAQALGETHPLVHQAKFVLGRIEERAGQSSGVARARAASEAYKARMSLPLNELLAIVH